MIELVHPLKLKVLEETGSTNTDAKNHADSGGDKFTVFWAKKQTSGRGRFNRKWESQEGNLFWSILLPLHQHLPPTSELSLVTGIAVKRTIQKYLNEKAQTVSVKWPNDVLIDSKKASGTLIEANPQAGWVVVGVGVNVKNSPSLTTSDSQYPIYPTTCICDEGGNADVSEVCVDLSRNFYILYKQWCEVGFSKQLREEYIAGLWQFKSVTTVSTNSDKSDTITGINKGINKEGCLLLELSNGDVKSISAADVHPACVD